MHTSRHSVPGNRTFRPALLPFRREARVIPQNPVQEVRSALILPKQSQLRPHEFPKSLRNVQEVREALSKFVTLYNEQWLLEKNRGRSPNQLRQDWLLSEHFLEAA